jgi:hypothetical protein
MRLPRTLGPAIHNVAQNAIGKDWSLYAALLEHWREIVGEEYAINTVPVKIIFPRGKKTDEKWGQAKRGGGSLSIRLPQGLAMEFSFLSEQIKKRINSYFGYEAIERIALETYYEEGKTLSAPRKELSREQKETLHKSLETIENSELREALENLGQSIASTSRNT